MNIALSEIPSINCGVINPGGNSSLELTPIEWSTKDPDINLSNNTYLGPIIFEPSTNWLNIPFKVDSLKITNSKTPNSQNGLYSNIIELQIAEGPSSLSTILDKYSKHLFIAKLKDKSGVVKLIGSKKSPCMFKHSYVSGGKSSDFKGYKIQIEQIHPTPPVFYPF